MKKDIKHCPGCDKDLTLDKFYNSKNTLMHLDGLSNICKTCLKEKLDVSNIKNVYEVLRSLNLPFIYKYWQKAIASNNDTFGAYIRMVNGLKQLQNKTWDDSIFSDESGESNQNSNMNNLKDSLDNINIDEEVILRWGTNHEKEDYIKLENFYKEMKDKNCIETPQDEDYLKKLSMISLKMDKELEAGHYDEVKKLGDLYSKYMADSKFRQMDKTEADKTGGIRNFSTIYKEVESDGFIPPWEYYRKLKGISQDIVDRTIMHIENFTLRLNKVSIMTEPPADTPKLIPEDYEANEEGEE
jgi:hypothetical protein